ncbi:MAG: hypothetical protein IKD94_07430 [Erysipelotrichaceae bacterium]|nr:hypothetical protein [Erysipelotrichaceae bacterium]
MKLDFKEINEETKELLPDSVYAFIQTFDHESRIRVAQINPEYADGQSLSEQYDIPYEMELNCLLVEGRRKDNISYAALIVPYGYRANMNAKVRNPLDAKEVRFADLDYVTKVTGMEYGSITPIGLPEDWKILVDASVFDQENVIVGGGLTKSKLLLPSALFKDLPNCIVVDGLKKE